MSHTGGDHDVELGHTTVLTGERGGKYPHGNSLLVRGKSETLLIDPSLSLIARHRTLPPVDRVVHSHCHEDHIAGSHLFPDVPWHFHEADIVGIRSLDDMMAIYGYDETISAAFRPAIVNDFHYTARPDALPFTDGAIFDAGGVRVRVIHAPGHTRGHCCLYVEPDDILYLGDIDLSSFGPYYGDRWSSLQDFERSLQMVRGIEARWYATFHHIGVLDGREKFLERLERFAAVIDSREARLLEFLREPHSIEDIVEHRFVYRPQDAVPFADGVEHRSMSQHVERLLARGHLAEREPGLFVAC